MATHLWVMLHTGMTLLWVSHVGVSPHVQQVASLSEPRGARKHRDDMVCIMHIRHEAPSCPPLQAQRVGGGGQAAVNNLEGWKESQ